MTHGSLRWFVVTLKVLMLAFVFNTVNLMVMLGFAMMFTALDALAGELGEAG